MPWRRPLGGPFPLLVRAMHLCPPSLMATMPALPQLPRLLPLLAFLPPPTLWSFPVLGGWRWGSTRGCPYFSQSTEACQRRCGLLLQWQRSPRQSPLRAAPAPLGAQRSAALVFPGALAGVLAAAALLPPHLAQLQCLQGAPLPLHEAAAGGAAQRAHQQQQQQQQQQ